MNDLRRLCEVYDTHEWLWCWGFYLRKTKHHDTDDVDMLINYWVQKKYLKWDDVDLIMQIYSSSIIYHISLEVPQVERDVHIILLLPLHFPYRNEVRCGGAINWREILDIESPTAIKQRLPKTPLLWNMLVKSSSLQYFVSRNKDDCNGEASDTSFLSLALLLLSFLWVLLWLYGEGEVEGSSS